MIPSTTTHANTSTFNTPWGGKEEEEGYVRILHLGKSIHDHVISMYRI